ncbi:ankyrin repeat domain-containing protein [Paraburkholderia sp. UYCP14C]|uniref:ankyrin repeat domain-containing protein n=1 Tax=Paraburkholderia sp. UYCP14C TaxID=2511130 RepID=UPI00101FF90E|nr:ankyrin repeat domain-containing protein [Paraburkholderia sp. UYCP14C]RZF23871.1 ankyrin repeat domain-containing protein [Paraburkholderia sp. UYCP14C]
MSPLTKTASRQTASLETALLENPSCRRTDIASADADCHAPPCVAVAKWLDAHDFPDTQSRGIDGITPLMLAALHGEDHIVASVLESGVGISALDDEGNHALWYACLGDAPGTILRLVGAGLALDHVNADDMTCLMQAAATGRIEVMWLLLALGASDSLVAPDGRDALDMAADLGRRLLQAVHELRGARLDSTGKSPYGPGGAQAAHSDKTSR